MLILIFWDFWDFPRIIAPQYENLRTSRTAGLIFCCLRTPEQARHGAPLCVNEKVPEVSVSIRHSIQKLGKIGVCVFNVPDMCAYLLLRKRFQRRVARLRTKILVCVIIKMKTQEKRNFHKSK